MPDRRSKKKEDDPVLKLSQQYASGGATEEEESKSDEAIGVRTARQHALLGEEEARRRWSLTQDLFNSGLLNQNFWFGYVRGSQAALHKPGFPGRRF